VRKRTHIQTDFDFTKHGWAFSDKEMLSKRIKMCRPLIAALATDDPRQEEFRQMEQALVEMSK